MNSQKYEVRWTQTALRALFNLYSVDHDQVYLNSVRTLHLNPHQQGETIYYPNYKYNGYLWTVIKNVIIVYSINEKNYSVRIRACYSAITGFALKIFYGEYDPF